MPPPAPALTILPIAADQLALSVGQPPTGVKTVYFYASKTAGASKAQAAQAAPAAGSTEVVTGVLVPRSQRFWTAKFYDGTFGPASAEQPEPSPSPVVEPPAPPVVLTDQQHLEQILGAELEAGDIVEVVQAAVASKVVQPDGSVK